MTKKKYCTERKSDILIFVCNNFESDINVIKWKFNIRRYRKLRSSKLRIHFLPISLPFFPVEGVPKVQDMRHRSCVMIIRLCNVKAKRILYIARALPREDTHSWPFNTPAFFEGQRCSKVCFFFLRIVPDTLIPLFLAFPAIYLPPFVPASLDSGGATNAIPATDTRGHALFAIITQHLRSLWCLKRFAIPLAILV